jgi:hypothetical protein
MRSVPISIIISQSPVRFPELPRPLLKANYAIDDALRDPVPQAIGLVDDVLTTGAHFRAASAILKQAFPGARVMCLLAALARTKKSRARWCACYISGAAIRSTPPPCLSFRLKDIRLELVVELD